MLKLKFTKVMMNKNKDIKRMLELFNDNPNNFEQKEIRELY